MPEENDNLVLTLRLFDPKEKRDPKLSASWVTLKVPRSDLAMSSVEFAAKYMNAIAQLEHFKGR